MISWAVRKDNWVFVRISSMISSSWAFVNASLERPGGKNRSFGGGGSEAISVPKTDKLGATVSAGGTILVD